MKTHIKFKNKTIDMKIQKRKKKQKQKLKKLKP